MSKSFKTIISSFSLIIALLFAGASNITAGIGIASISDYAVKALLYILFFATLIFFVASFKTNKNLYFWLSLIPLFLFVIYLTFGF